MTTNPTLLVGNACDLKARGKWGRAPTPFQAIANLQKICGHRVFHSRACVRFQLHDSPHKIHMLWERRGSNDKILYSDCRVVSFLSFEPYKWLPFIKVIL